MPPPIAGRWTDTGQHQLRVGAERHRGADLGAALRLVRGLLVGLPLIAYAPVHFLLARFMPKAQ